MKKEDIKNVITKIVNKTIYIIEYFISFLLVKELLGIIITKSYSDYYPLNKLIYAGILGLILLGIIIYICIKSKKVIEKIFLAFAIPISIAFAIFILPLNVPDEGSHILKAYDVSLGYIFPRIDEQGESYCTTTKELENYSYLRFQKYADIQKELSRETNYEETVNIISASQSYCPILYIGPTIAITIVRLIDVNIFYALYLGRLFNTIIFLILGYFSIKTIPFGKMMLALYLCMPMMMQQAGSCSADAVLNATLIYYITFLMYIIFKEKELTKKDKIIIYILTALIGMFKYIYILVAGILFITVFNKKEEKKQYLKTIGIMILIGSVFSIGWFIITSNYKSVAGPMLSYYESANVKPSRQVNYIIENPIDFAITLAKEFIFYGSEYIFGAVGSSLGWSNINIEMGIITAYIILIIIATISEKSEYEFKVKSKLWILTIILTISVILKMIMYLTFTPVGMERVCGLQGRYYTPILFLAVSCLIKKNNNWKVNNVQEKMMTMALVLNIFTLLTVISNYM